MSPEDLKKGYRLGVVGDPIARPYLQGANTQAVPGLTQAVASFN